MSVETLEFERKPMSYYESMILSGIPFNYMRFCDGEWHSVLLNEHAEGLEAGMKNRDGHAFFPSMNRMMATLLVFSREDHHYAVGLPGKHWAKVTAWCNKHRVNVDWVCSGTFSDANRLGKFGKFLSALSERRLMIVGPKWLGSMPRELLSWNVHVECENVNVFQTRSDLVMRVCDIVESDRIEVILWSSGLPTALFIDDVWSQFDSVTNIDCGAIWDGYCGKMTRGYHNDVNWDEVKAANIRGRTAP